MWALSPDPKENETGSPYELGLPLVVEMIAAGIRTAVVS